MFSTPRNKTGRSIRTALLWWLLPFATIFMAFAWLIHGTLLERMSRDFVHGRLQQEASFLERQIRKAYPDVEAILVQNQYFEEVFHHVFALRIGDQTAVSHSQWRAQLLPLLEKTQTGIMSVRARDANQAGPGPRLLAFRKGFDIGNESVVILVAEDYSALQSSQRELHLWTAAVSAALLLFLAVLILLAVAIALRPVRQMRRELSELQTGARDRLSQDAPDEFESLISQLNHLLDTLDSRLERSRQGIANLSHSIKTPVSALIQILADRSTPVDGDLREQMISRLDDLDRQLEAEIRRSQVAGSQAGKTAAPLAQAREITWMLGRLYEDKQFDLNTDLDPQSRWPIEEQDFAELVGNLADNAGKWANERVCITLRENQNQLVIEVDDDGPGVAAAARGKLGIRGLRLDEQTAGHGLGLAIVRDVIERYQGQLALSKSALGGLSAQVRLSRTHESPQR